MSVVYLLFSFSVTHFWCCTFNMPNVLFFINKHHVHTCMLCTINVQYACRLCSCQSLWSEPNFLFHCWWKLRQRDTSRACAWSLLEEAKRSRFFSREEMSLILWRSSLGMCAMVFLMDVTYTFTAVNCSKYVRNRLKLACLTCWCHKILRWCDYLCLCGSNVYITFEVVTYDTVEDSVSTVVSVSDAVINVL